MIGTERDLPMPATREPSPMDGIHDVGGEQGFGRVEPTAEEPPFEQDWEARLVGIFRAITRPREERIGTPTSSASQESNFRQSSI